MTIIAGSQKIRALSLRNVATDEFAESDIMLEDAISLAVRLETVAAEEGYVITVGALLASMRELKRTPPRTLRRNSDVTAGLSERDA